MQPEPADCLPVPNSGDKGGVPVFQIIGSLFNHWTTNSYVSFEFWSRLRSFNAERFWFSAIAAGVGWEKGSIFLFQIIGSISIWRKSLNSYYCPSSIARSRQLPVRIAIKAGFLVFKSLEVFSLIEVTIMMGRGE